MTDRGLPRTAVALAAVSITAALAAVGAGVARADSAPVGQLPAGPAASTTTSPGLLVAVALPHAARNSGLVWRVARRYDSRVVREISEADVGANVVLVFKVIGRGDTSLVFALTRGDTSPAAVKAATHKIHSV